MAQGKVVGQSGGYRINGIIEQYIVAAGENINIGDFVQYTNEYDTIKKEISDNYATDRLAICALNDATAFLAYGAGSELYGMIATINSGKISTSTPVQLSSNSNSGQYIDVIKLSETSVFILSGSSSTNYVMVCTIDGNNITGGTPISAGLDQYSVGRRSMVALTSALVCVAYAKNNSYYGYANYFTISGTTITSGTELKVDSGSSFATYGTCISKESDTKVCAIFLNASAAYKRTLTIDVHNATITVSDYVVKNLTTNYPGAICSFASLGGSAMFITFGSSGSTLLYGIIWNGSSFGTSTQLDRHANSGVRPTPVYVTQIKTLIFYQDTVYNLHRMTCTRSGTTITVEDTGIVGDFGTARNHAATFITTGKILLLHDKKEIYNSGLQSKGITAELMFTANLLLPVNDAEQRITGIAKQKGTSGEQIKVIVPNFTN